MQDRLDEESSCSPIEPVGIFFWNWSFVQKLKGKRLNTACVCITCNPGQGANIIKHSDNTVAIERIPILKS